MAFVDLNGRRLFHEVCGEGEPVLLIPGLGATHASYRPVAPALAQRHLVVSLDLAGAGQSDPAPAYSMEAWADDVLALMDHLGLASAHIVGSSLGGCVAMALADRALPRVRSLVLAATFAEVDPLLELNYRVRIALVEQTGMSELFANYALALLFGRSVHASERGRAITAFAAQALRQNDPDTYVAHLKAILRFGRCEPEQRAEHRFTERLPGLDRPALVLVGDEDVLTAPVFSRQLAQGLPQARLEVLPGCGHATFAEAPDASADLILSFLADIAATGSR
jgi:pimeloyl-ACP methyl ester carboxylesterase